MRIERIASHIDNCKVFADVGCDHGLISLAVAKRGICEKIIASDISEKCLSKAKKNLRDYPNVIYRVCDGIPEDMQPDFIVICGMGGHTITEILSRYGGNSKLLVSPQSHAELVRGHLCRHDYAITYDKCFEDRGKYYDIIKAEYCSVLQAMDELQLKFGSYKEKNAALLARVTRMLDKLPPLSEKRRELEEVLKWQK